MGALSLLFMFLAPASLGFAGYVFSAKGDANLFYPGVCFLFALLWLYWLLAHCFNRTVFTVSQDELSITHEPVPWFGDGSTDISKVYFLYSFRRFDKQRMYRFNYYAKIHGQSDKCLFRFVRIEKPDVANLTIEKLRQTIELFHPIRFVEEFDNRKSISKDVM